MTSTLGWLTSSPWGAFSVALAVRVVATSTLALTVGDALFNDDQTYHQMASDLASGSSREWRPAEQRLYDQTSVFLAPLSWMYSVFGAHRVLGQIFVAVFGALVAALVAWLTARRLAPPFPAVAVLIVALMPSQVVFSVVILKDALVWAAAAIVAIGATVLADAKNGRSLLRAAAITTPAIVALGFLRQHTALIAIAALVLSAVVLARRRRTLIITGVGALVLVVPVVAGLGPLGTRLLDRAGSLAEIRARAAGDAETTYVDVEEVRRDGATVRRDATPTPLALVRGVAAMLLRPYPWETTTRGVALARYENLLWYPALALAAVGLAAVWRHRPCLLFPALFMAGVVVVGALSHGNVGTAYRHRGEFVWVVAIAAAFGVRSISDRVAGRRSGDDASTDHGWRGLHRVSSR